MFHPVYLMSSGWGGGRVDARYLTDSCTKWHPLSLCGCMRVERLASAAFIKHCSKAPYTSNMPSNWPSLATLASKCDKNCGSSIVALHLEGMVWIIFPPQIKLDLFFVRVLCFGRCLSQSAQGFMVEPAGGIKSFVWKHKDAETTHQNKEETGSYIRLCG